MPAEFQGLKPIASLRMRSPGFVLIVDDENINRIMLRDSMEARGYEVEEAENGLRALQKITARPPDVILLDLMMPKMDGFEVCRRLRKDAKTAHIPILMITALYERGDRLMGIQAGGNDFLRKPIDIVDVILRVGNAVHSKQLHDQLQIEREKSERLLLNILPKRIAERMKKGETNIADIFPDVTMLVTDLVGFPSLSAFIDSEQIVQLLNVIFSAFDILVEKHGLEKIKTVGQAYIVAGGLSTPRPDHAEAMAELAINLREEMERLNQQYDTTICLRTGISTGPVIAGVIGREKFAYDVWGETVSLACRLESTGEAGRIQVAESTYQRLKDKYQFEKRPGNDVTAQGSLPAYWLDTRLAHEQSRSQCMPGICRKTVGQSG